MLANITCRARRLKGVIIGRWCENTATLPAIELGVAGVALGGPFLGAAHDVERHQQRELPREIIVSVLETGRLARHDQYLATDIFAT